MYIAAISQQRNVPAVCLECRNAVTIVEIIIIIIYISDYIYIYLYI